VKEGLPNHLAIIMDGNGRWAEARGYPRSYGHIKGARTARRVIERCTELGIKHLTLYAFSTENWLRPKSEVSLLFRLLEKNLRRERKILLKQNIQFAVVGDISKLPKEVQREINKTVAVTSANTGLRLVFALNYGGRQEIVRAAQLLCEKVAAGTMKPSDVDLSAFEKALPSNPMPPIDLVIRTSGEQRISNFLIWQLAYAEIAFTPDAWPAFTAAKLEELLQNFAGRERRFGKTGEQIKSEQQSVERISIRKSVRPDKQYFAAASLESDVAKTADQFATSRTLGLLDSREPSDFELLSRLSVQEILI